MSDGVNYNYVYYAIIIYTFGATYYTFKYTKYTLFNK